jgi:hypothetical protein
MKFVMATLSAAVLGGALVCAPAQAHHNGETGGVVREGGHHHAPGHKAKGDIIREGGHSHRQIKPHHGPHWGRRHHHGVHLEGSH